MTTLDPTPVVATYRLQLSEAFGLDAAARLVPYLAGLGVSHVYLSPILQANPGSTHGYDVADPTRINPELGGAEALERLSEALRSRGMGLVLDIVPNHMAASQHNRWWWDVLRRGRASAYASYFDIDWDAPEAHLHGKVMLPVLGDEPGALIAAGEFTLDPDDDGQAVLRYHDHAFPLSDASIEELGLKPGPGAPVPDAQTWRALLDKQAYRLTHWRRASRELNYRRFFAVNQLVAVRVEDPGVFEATHALTLDLVRRGVVQGLRVDHPDGLRDPATYFERLRAAAPDAWIVVEKILEPGEPLPKAWPVQGTTGYDFLNRVQGLLIDPASEEAMSRTYQSFTGIDQSYPDMLYEKKLFVIDTMFGGELNRLATVLAGAMRDAAKVSETAKTPERSGETLRGALRELLAAFPVYRTYRRVGETLTPFERDSIAAAATTAKERRPDLDAGLLDRIGALLSSEPGDAAVDFAARFGQLSGPVMAKGAEDTTFYLYNRLTALNEVGGDPGHWSLALDAFHRASAQVQRDWPRAMLTTSTHDTKRSEDVRARLCVLSEAPQRWAEAVGRWRDRNAKHRRNDTPDRNAEYLLYQTLVGAWPLPVDRALAYMRKATREASVFTTWADPDADYEAALGGFVEAILSDDAFVADLEAFVSPLIHPGRVNALSQLLIKLTAPGIPDIYQGTELWDLSLVDPDNRRPIDYDLRRGLTAALPHATAEEAMRRIDEGLPKLFVTHHTLGVRRDHPEAFGPTGDYQPLPASGDKAGCAVCFSRGGRAITVAPRLAWSLRDGWLDTRLRLPGGAWRNVFTNERREGELLVGDLLRAFPVALLVKE